MTYRKPLQSPQSGIALLMTIMVLSVVLSVTLAIVELSLKQLALSVDTRDSEIAFHAANAGLECARYTRRMASTTIEAGNAVRFNCFGLSPSLVAKTANASDGLDIESGASEGNVYRYQTNLSWSGTTNRCSSIDMVTIIMNANSTSNLVLTADNGDSLGTIFPEYPGSKKTCAPGAVCTIVAVRGYNAPCNSLTNPGTLKRQVLLEF